MSEIEKFQSAASKDKGNNLIKRENNDKQIY